MKKTCALLALVLMVISTSAAARAPEASPAPHFEAHGNAIQLIVDGKPFLMLGGELGNSSASDLNYLRPRWQALQALHLNTVLSPVYWELIEPVEGQFDWSSVDGLLRDARAHHMRLVLLWFGSWKNSMSSYAPAWVKRDDHRFPRARTSDGHALEELSAFSSENRDADARVFAALMAHLKTADTQHTVLMVQVENEIGMIPEARDHSPAAEAAYAGPVPQQLMDYLAAHRDTLAAPLRARWQGQGSRTFGTWEQVFGRDPATDEIFMAWYFATYTQAVAAAGRREYLLPFYVNAALIRPGRKPGEYPSAGPLPQVFDVWRAGAPTIDALSPDIYFPNFVEWARAYDIPNNPYFVPETGRQPEATPANAFYAFGAHDSMGFSPFAIEDFAADDDLGKAYDVLEGLTPIILQHQGDGSMVGVRPIVAFDGTVDASPQDVTLGAYRLHVTFGNPFAAPAAQNQAAPGAQGQAYPPGLNPAPYGGLIVQLGPQEFLIAGKGLVVTFAQADGITGLESVWEGHYEAGVWKPGRLLNGDQTHQGRHVRLPADSFGVQRVRLYRYS